MIYGSSPRGVQHASLLIGAPSGVRRVAESHPTVSCQRAASRD
jgi:hypothetical protein